MERNIICLFAKNQPVVNLIGLTSTERNIALLTIRLSKIIDFVSNQIILCFFTLKQALELINYANFKFLNIKSKMCW